MFLPCLAVCEVLVVALSRDNEACTCLPFNICEKSANIHRIGFHLRTKRNIFVVRWEMGTGFASLAVLRASSIVGSFLIHRTGALYSALGLCDKEFTIVSSTIMANTRIMKPSSTRLLLKFPTMIDLIRCQALLDYFQT